MSTRDNRFTPGLTVLASKPAKHAPTKSRPT
jgi:hypothetical protein